MLFGQLQIAQAAPCDMQAQVQAADSASDHHAHMQHGGVKDGLMQAAATADAGPAPDCCGSGDCPMTTCAQPTAAAASLTTALPEATPSERYHATSSAA